MHTKPHTLFEKLWDAHVVYQERGGPAILYIDGMLLYEVTSPQAFAAIREKKMKVRRPERCLATCDHNVSTIDQTNVSDILSLQQIKTLEKNCEEFGIRFYGLNSPHQGIIHVIGPELGFVQPGMTVVCGDSHTSIHGAFGALAMGIGTSEVEMILATTCLLQNKPKTMKIEVSGNFGKGVSAKDLILYIIKKIGVSGGVGHAIEYTGETIRNLEMEERLTVCNMTVEAGSRFGMISPDEKTFNYLKDRTFAPKGEEFAKKVEEWKKLKTDDGAVFEKNVEINASEIEPMITYGTNPEQGIKISEKIPHPSDFKSEIDRRGLVGALEYMDLRSGMSLEGLPIDMVFIGSCTNSRLSDLRTAANIVKGKKVRQNIKALVVPGSKTIKRQAEEEGLDKIFKEAGFEWRHAGCSSCVAMNEDKVPPGKYCVSTSNRNYEGRQGPGARTFLASPIMAAMAAIEGAIVDVRKYL